MVEMGGKLKIMSLRSEDRIQGLQFEKEVKSINKKDEGGC